MNRCVVPVETKHASVASPAICTSCGKRGNKVERRTLEHLIKSDSLKDIAESQRSRWPQPKRIARVAPMNRFLIHRGHLCDGTPKPPIRKALIGATKTANCKNLVRKTRIFRLATQHYFCKTPTCEVVYFDGKGSVFPKAALTVRGGLKETEDPVPVCYCFGFTREMMRDEIARQGETTIPETIKKEIQAGNCACDVKNPSGRCCLGEVMQLAKEICADSLNKAQVHPCCVPPIQVTQKISDRRG